MGNVSHLSHCEILANLPKYGVWERSLADFANPTFREVRDGLHPDSHEALTVTSLDRVWFVQVVVERTPGMRTFRAVEATMRAASGNSRSAGGRSDRTAGAPGRRSQAAGPASFARSRRSGRVSG